MTPASDGRHVLIANGSGVVACYDLEGRRKWITQLTSIKGDQHHGFHSSPLVMADKLIVYSFKEYRPMNHDGKVLWSTPGKEMPGLRYGSRSPAASAERTASPAPAPSSTEPPTGRPRSSRQGGHRRLWAGPSWGRAASPGSRPAP